MSSRVLVTGAYGYIGRHTARRFAEGGWHVVGIGHGTWSREEAHAWGVTEWRAADISFDALANSGPPPDAIVHCAGSGSVGYSLTHPFQDFSRSAATIAATLEYARLHAPRTRVVFLSSAAVYGQVDEGIINENTTLNPISPYGIHKVMGESLCQMYGLHYGISSSVLRLFSMYGRGLRKQLLWDACTKASRGEAEFAGTGDETRDWLDMVDAAELIFLAVKQASPLCPIANGGTGEAPRIRAVLEELFLRLGVQGAPHFTGVVRSGDPKHYRAGISVAKRWGWVPKVSWREGIRAYAEWFRNSAP
jgi:UDP-glucose 4-epimerase